MVPEGLIVHKGTGRRFYIIHYGGEDVNVFNILDYDDKRDDYKFGLRVDGNKNNSKVVSRDLDNKEPRFQWKIELQTTNTIDTTTGKNLVKKNILRLKSIYNNKYLYLGLDPVNGNAQFSTVDINNYKSHPAFKFLTDTQLSDGVNYSFIPAFGTNMNIIDNANRKKIN